MVKKTEWSAEEVLKRVDIDIKTGCWNWNNSLIHNGYGRIKVINRSIMAHRFSYQIFKGEIYDFLEIDHLCRNRKCVNPDHLEAVTSRVNVLRGQTITAINSMKTHCIHGHELSGDNVLIRKNGRRRCQTCEKENQKRARSTSAYRKKHAMYERQRRKIRKESKMEKDEIIAQGDILLRKILAIPHDAKPIKSCEVCVIAEGEATGHRHITSASDSTLYSVNDNSPICLVIHNTTFLTHEEHDPLKLDEGIYEIIRQREFDDENEWRQVAD